MVVLEIGCGAYAPFARICTEEGADKAFDLAFVAAFLQALKGKLRSSGFLFEAYIPEAERSRASVCFSFQGL